MPRTRKTQYTIRDVPVTSDSRLREVAALEDISLNQAALRALERGLGISGEPIRYRSLRQMVPEKNSVDLPGWKAALAEMDRVNPEDWK